MNKLWMACAFMLLTVNVYADNYLIVTDKRYEKKVISKYVFTVFKKARHHVVSLKKNIKYGDLPEIVKNNLRKVRLSDVRSYRVNTVLKNYDPTVKQIIDQVSSQNIERIVDHLNTYKTRKMSRQGNQDAGQWIKTEFISLGLATEEHCFKRGVCNIIGKRHGDATLKTIIVIGHFDTVGRSNAGADDNGSGTAGVIEIARVLSTSSRNINPILFIASNGEERGLLGSKAHVKKLKSQRTISNIGHVYNMDMIGYNTGDLVDIGVDNEFEYFAQNVAQIFKTYTNLNPRVNTPAWGSDHVSYSRAMVPALMTIEDTGNLNPCYHRSCDTSDKVDFEYAREIVRGNLASILTI